MLRRTNLLLLLLAVFLSAQLLTASHEAAHEISGEADQCEICLRVGQYKAVAVAAKPATFALSPATPPRPYLQSAPQQATLANYQARGPPTPEAV